MSDDEPPEAEERAVSDPPPPSGEDVDRAAGDDDAGAAAADKPAAAPSVPRRRVLVPALLAAVLAVGAGAYWFASRPEGPSPVAPRPPPKGVLEAVPAGAMVVATVDLEALRSSPLAAPYLSGERSIEGLGNLRQACGFDPLTSVEEIAFAVPPGDEADFGLVASGAFGDAAVVECATKMIAARGGKPVTSSLGSFRTVRDVAGANAGEIAIRGGGPLLIGGGPFLRAMVDTADGALPSVANDAAHAALRADLAGHDTAKATLVLSKEQRAAVAEEIARSGGAAPSALGAIGSAGLGVALAGERARLRVIVACDDEASARALADLATQAQASAGESTPAALLGAEELLARIHIEASGSRLVANVDASVSELEAMIDRAVQVRAIFEAARKRTRREAPAPAPAPRPRPSP